MKELIVKFKAGDPLTNTDLDTLIKHYGDIVTLLGEHGEIYGLVWLDCYLALERLRGYKNARDGGSLRNSLNMSSSSDTVPNF